MAWFIPKCELSKKKKIQYFVDVEESDDDLWTQQYKWIMVIAEHILINHVMVLKNMIHTWMYIYITVIKQL